MSAFRPLTDDVSVGGQVMPDDMADLAARGIKTIINNRPEGEMPGQPGSEALSAAAKAAGIDYVYLPMAGGISLELIEGSAAAYADLPGPKIAFCASGMRSVALWCFALVKDNGVESVLQTAADAGYNLAHMKGVLEGYAQS